MTRSGLYTHSEQMQPQHFLNSVPHTVIVGIHLQGECVSLAAYVDFNLFELLTSKLKMKVELCDVQVKRERKFGQHTVCVTVCVCVCVHECVHIHIKRSAGIEEG